MVFYNIYNVVRQCIYSCCPPSYSDNSDIPFCTEKSSGNNTWWYFFLSVFIFLRVGDSYSVYMQLTEMILPLYYLTSSFKTYCWFKRGFLWSFNLFVRQHYVEQLVTLPDSAALTQNEKHLVMSIVPWKPAEYSL